MSESLVQANHWICPFCDGQFYPINGDKSTHFGCPICGTFYVDAWDEPKRIIRQYNEWGHLAPTIPLGATGLLNGVEYTLVGMMQKIEKDDVSECWNEYLLYSSAKNSAILVEYNGHWMLVEPIAVVLQAEEVGTGEYIVNYQGEVYRLYHSYDFLVRNAVGEFDWNILEDEHQPVYEYTLGSKMLTQELINGIPYWYIGNYVSAADIAITFGIPQDSLPYQTGTHVLQGNPYEKYRKPLIRVAMIMTFLAGAVQLLFSQLYPSSVLLNEHYTTKKDSAALTLRPIISPSFHLQYRSAIYVNFDAGVDNDWLEVNTSLVNEATGLNYVTSKSIEYYRGYEDGESWTEGSTTKEALFSSVPPGDYHLNLLPASEGGKEVMLNVRVTHSNWIMSNFIIMMLAIISAPVINQILYANFEKSRNPV